MWYYVFAIKIKYNERKKVRHITIPLYCSHDSCIWPVIIIQFPKKFHLTTLYTELKRKI